MRDSSFTRLLQKRQSSTARTSWVLRRGFWNWLAVFKFTHQAPAVIPVPAAGDDKVAMVGFTTKYPGIPIAKLQVAEHIPGDERVRAKQIFTKVQHWLVRRFSPMRPGLPPISQDAEKALRQALTPAHRRCYPAPERPTSFDVGSMAVASPYASYLRSTDSGAFTWDLGSLRRFDCHPGLVPLHAVVDFDLDTKSGRLNATRIATDEGTSTPDDPGWDRATRMAMCTITSHATMARHFNWLHLTGGPTLEAATRNTLSARHPIRRLVWPHVFGTHAGNELVTEILMSNGGEFSSIFSLTHGGLCHLFEATTDDFSLTAINPRRDAANRGTLDDHVATPAQDNWIAHFDVMLAHARRYLAVYYSSDDDVANDEEFGAWLDELDRRLPNGVREIVGEAITIDSAAELLATIIYLATVEHEITGSGLWSYQMWNDVSPVRVHADGSNVPIDVYQRLVNANFNLNVHRTMLLDDGLGDMALEAHGAWAFQQFQQDLLELQARMDRSTPQPWRIEPRHLKSNINA